MLTRMDMLRTLDRLADPMNEDLDVPVSGWVAYCMTEHDVELWDCPHGVKYCDGHGLTVFDLLNRALYSLGQQALR